MNIAQAALRLLCWDDRSWTRTLQFIDGSRYNFLFSYAERHALLELHQIAGLLLHNGNHILIPPSRMGLARLSYFQPESKLLDTPQWLMQRDLWEGEWRLDPYKEPPSDIKYSAAGTWLRHCVGQALRLHGKKMFFYCLFVLCQQHENNSLNSGSH